MTEEPVRITRRSRAWPAWAGSIAELQRIASAMQKLADQRRDALIAAYERENPPPPPAADDDPYESGKYQSRMAIRQTKLDELREGPSLRVSLTELTSDEVAGIPEVVFAELDRRTAKRIEFAARFHYSFREERLEVTMDRHGNRIEKNGVELTVTSIDQGWARQAAAELSEEIDRGVPWFAVLRRGFGYALFCLAAFALIAATLALLLSLSGLSALLIAFMLVAIGFAYGGVMAESDLIRRWLFPPMEIINEGEKPAGSRVIPFMVTLVLTSILGIAINAIR